MAKKKYTHRQAHDKVWGKGHSSNSHHGSCPSKKSGNGCAVALIFILSIPVALTTIVVTAVQTLT